MVDERSDPRFGFIVSTLIILEGPIRLVTNLFWSDARPHGMTGYDDEMGQMRKDRLGIRVERGKDARRNGCPPHRGPHRSSMRFEDVCEVVKDGKGSEGREDENTEVGGSRTRTKKTKDGEHAGRR